MVTEQPQYWTNPSVINLAGDSDPIDFMQKRARQLVLEAIQEGWAGPPFDPFKLAEYLDISVIPREDIQDARIVASSRRRLRIEFNPNRPRGRMRFSVAHEISHSLFPDCAEEVRSRGRAEREDSWQLELLCNLAAAEILMPIGTARELEREPVLIDNILRLQKEYDVSTEAICLRLVKVTDEPCIVFAAARTWPEFVVSASYRIDYSIPSRSIKYEIPRGFRTTGETILSQCTAIGFTAKGTEWWAENLPKVYIECVGIPSYPNHSFPRVIGIARFKRGGYISPTRIKFLRGDALQPRSDGKQIIAHVVNDKTPNWGGFGFAYEVKRRIPSVQDTFRNWAISNRENLTLGKIHLSPLSNDLTIVSMIAQHGYGPSRKPGIRYEALKYCLDQLAEIALTKRASVHMPRIGGGQAGGNWAIIEELIDDALVRRGIDVTIYTLPTYHPTEETQGLLKLNSSFKDR